MVTDFTPIVLCQPDSPSLLSLRASSEPGSGMLNPGNLKLLGCTTEILLYILVVHPDSQGYLLIASPTHIAHEKNKAFDFSAGNGARPLLF